MERPCMVYGYQTTLLVPNVMKSGILFPCNDHIKLSHKNLHIEVMFHFLWRFMQGSPIFSLK